MRLSVEALDTAWPPQHVAVMAMPPKSPRRWTQVHETTGPTAVAKANRVAEQLREGTLKVDWKQGKVTGD